MWTRARVPLLASAAAVALLLLAALAWLWVQRRADPLEALRRDPGEIRVVRDSSYPAVTATGEERLYRDLTISTVGAGVIRITTSRPAEPATGRMPLLVILAGLRTGRESLGVVPAHGPNLLVGYQYPYDQETWYQRARPAQVPAIRRAALDVPWQVAHVAGRMRAEPYVDPGRTALLGYSFGAMFVPAAQRLAADQGHAFDAAILAFGGVDIEALMDANLDLGPPAARRAVAWLGATLLHALEPELHLPHLTGRFLVIRGAADRQIPAEVSERLAELTPEPREVITLDAGHMNPRDPLLTDRVVRLSQEWLVRTGVADPAACSGQGCQSEGSR
ncbi:MAG TPA: prolyl oligopeptidase family serine peptidase [Longimicrobiales bacterium]|nr:prolyl oligopeptidase family serine peptidase [Longimicrobiales bacterium]